VSLIVEPPPVESLDAGVIEEARRRQRRHHAAAAAAALAAGLALVLALGSGGDAQRAAPAPSPLRLPSSPTWLSGPALRATRLRLVAAEWGRPAAIVDVDTGQVTQLPQLDVPKPPSLGSMSLSLVAGDAFAAVSHQACGHCSITEDDFLIDANGSVRRTAERHFRRLAGTTEREQVPGTTSEWVLRWPHRGACTLRLVPSNHPAATVPCGNLGAVLPSSVELWTHSDTRGILIDPLSGSVLHRLNGATLYDLVGHGLAVEGPAQGAGSLGLVNLATGRRVRLGWPSTLHFGYQVIPEPSGPLVAIEFADPAYPPPPRETSAQAADIWLLDTRTAKLAHLPGFPILEWLKLSSVTWTANRQLAIIAAGGGRTVLGLWQGGQRAVDIRAIPRLSGYSQAVALSG
jgi:hypothetical protein